MQAVRETERVQTVIIGGGQAGLSVGYFLARRGLPFVILEANDRVGDSWRKRWDSLRLFTPARFDGLAGMPFPDSGNAFPTKDEMARFLESYVAQFRLPVRTGVRVDHVSRHGDGYLVRAGDLHIEAEHVVVAMADFQHPRVPSFAAELDRQIVQIHSAEYRNPSQLRDGGVLVVGAGNSGAEIAREVVRGHPVWLSGRDVGHVPFRVDGLAARLLLARLVLRGVFHRLLTLNTPIGRKVYPTAISRGGPLIRVKPAELKAEGVERAPRTVGARDGLPLLEDGRTPDVTNIIWCTGFEPGFSWIDLPVFGADGRPAHVRGIATGEAGLYFVGLHFLYAMSSTMIHGVARDAEHVAGAIAGRIGRAPRRTEAPLSHAG